jgi:hypothetical protein
MWVIDGVEMVVGDVPEGVAMFGVASGGGAYAR